MGRRNRNKKWGRAQPPPPPPEAPSSSTTTQQNASTWTDWNFTCAVWVILGIAMVALFICPAEHAPLIHNMTSTALAYIPKPRGPPS